jgi:hypothetical protein
MMIRISKHAREQAADRNISLDLIKIVAKSPQQMIISEEEGMICQSLIFDYDMNKEMLFRVIVTNIGAVRYVITAYKTSKIEKYWSG